MKISVVSPVYNAENIVEELVKQVSHELSLLTSDFEIILVYDGSPDKSWEAIKQQCERHKFVKGISLSRNFGQHNAISAGLSEATGDVIVLMDCDLQDDPKHIQLLVTEHLLGNDIVYTKRIERKHNLFKTITAKIYNGTFTYIANKDFDIDVGSLVLFSKQVKDEYIQLKEHNKLYIQALKWLGFTHTYVFVEHRKRFEGKSSYKTVDLMRIAIQGMVSNSEKLLYLSIKLGFTFAFISALIVMFIVFKSFTTNFSAGWPSLVSIMLLCTGMILICLGIIGVYIGKIFQEAQNRPLFIIKEKINLNE